MRRELASYFATPLAYLFLLIFLVLANLFTFYLGGFFERGQADLNAFFSYHPWLFLFLIPAVSMRLWADERRTGSIELLMTLPVTLWQAVVGKFLAAWAFTILALALTFPMWITVNFLGSPDNGAILAAYIGSTLLAAGFLSIGSLASALTRNPVVAFIVGIALCFVFLVAGFPLVLDAFRGWAPQFAGGCGGLAGLPDAFRSHLQGGHRHPRPDLLRAAHQLVPAGHRRRARRAQVGMIVKGKS